MKKLSGGAASAVLPAVSELSQRAAQKIVLNIRNFSICTGTIALNPQRAAEGFPPPPSYWVVKRVCCRGSLDYRVSLYRTFLFGCRECVL